MNTTETPKDPHKQTHSTPFGWEVTVKGKEWRRVENAFTAGQAKYAYHRDIREVWPDVPYTALRCRKLGGCVTSDEFTRTAIYRGMPGLRCGQRVIVGGAHGVIVGHNSSSNFQVLLDPNSHQHAGIRLNCHPSSIAIDGSILRAEI